MKYFRIQAHSRNRINCVDKARNSIIENFITSKQLCSIQDAFIPLSDDPAALNQTSLTCQLAARMAFLLSYAGALRGESTRMIELSDLSSVFAEKEGAKGCDLLVLTLGEGKTNKYGKYTRSAIMRHRDVEMCATGALALYLFSRYHFRGEPFPSFDRREHWFFEKVIQPMNQGGRRANNKGKGRQIHGQDAELEEEDDADEEEEDGHVGDRDVSARDESLLNDEAARLFMPHDGSYGVDLRGDLVARLTARPAFPNAQRRPADLERETFRAAAARRLKAIPRSQPISYATQSRQFRAALAKTDIVTGRLTHIGRAASASVVAQAGMDLETQLRRHGHWNQSDVMSNCYIESFRESLRLE